MPQNGIVCLQDDPNDERRNVTGGIGCGLYSPKAAAAYNFYSSTEDALGISRDPKGIRTLFQHPWTGIYLYVWQVQEPPQGVGNPHQHWRRQ